MKKNYIYNYGGYRDKLDCPSCHRRKCFAPFLHYQTNQPLIVNGIMAGKCDHEHSCKYYVPPRDLGVKNPPLSMIEGSYLYSYSSNPSELNNQFKDNYTTTLDLSDELIYQYYCNREASGLYQYLTKIAPSQDDLLRVSQQYELGADKKGGIIFWQKDLTDKYHTGKIMYGHNPQTGKRPKDTDRPPFSWAHSKLQKAKPELIGEDFQLSQCPFGLHLCKDTSKNVCIVEAEKTAVIMALFYPQFIWISVGSCTQFKADILKLIPQNTLYIYPDFDAEKDWKEKKEKLELTTNKRLVFVDWWQEYPEFIKKNPTADPADLIEVE